MRGIKWLMMACSLMLMTACSDSSVDEPDGGRAEEISLQASQQNLQNQFLNSKGGLRLSVCATDRADVYDGDLLFWLMFDMVTEPYQTDNQAEEGVIFGPPSLFMPLYAMKVRGGEPIVPYLGVSYADVNYNQTPYPLVSEGGDIEFPAVKLKAGGTYSLEKYTLTDYSVQVDGKTVEHVANSEFVKSVLDSEYVDKIEDEGGYKMVHIKANKAGKSRIIWLKFVNPSCEYIFNEAENAIYLQIEQAAR